ncbi:MAG TPA: Bax inhibitor-1/YccA family protein [Verrucomicrobiae bacterium]|jgi:uncharacterized YccA/Bax inhibitor family protein|nr:Bax inhibitor-1/YccA family protein [Verrucomicrobiae bacterium]
MDTSNPLLKRDIDFTATGEATASMNLEGVVNKTGILLLLCVGAGAFAWSQPDLQSVFIFGGMIGGLIACLVGMFKPATTPISAPIYAVCEGLCLGALSQILNAKFPGIMMNAALLTFAVLGIMLFLYVTRIVRVTEKMVMGIIMATGAIAVVYLADMVMRMFGSQAPFIHDTGPVGIGISVVIVAIAAFNLLVDFAVIESNIRRQAPKYMEWYSGMALLITLVWLYLELLRLLSKMRSR